jgi:hypothetical protein
MSGQAWKGTDADDDDDRFYNALIPDPSLSQRHPYHCPNGQRGYRRHTATTRAAANSQWVFKTPVDVKLSLSLTHTR